MSFIIAILLLLPLTGAFVPQPTKTTATASTPPIKSFVALQQAKLSSLPAGISPFEKSNSQSVGIAADIRSRALSAIQRAIKDGVILQEIEFPPLLDSGKTQFDDFDNLQELDKNVDWCVELLPKLDGETWFLLPDLKECICAKKEWTGQSYRKAARFTTIEAVTNHYTKGGYSKPWGVTFVESLSKLTGTALLGNEDALDDLSTGPPPNIHLVCQPGNGGPVEDWCNVEILHNNALPGTTTIIVNGALDKVRDGYYAGIFFPKLAATVDRFYKTFEPIFFLKPISDKGVYGWVYRVYPEPWQVVLQTVQQKDDSQRQYVENTVVSTSEKRPTYAEAVNMLLQGQQKILR